MNQTSTKAPAPNPASPTYAAPPVIRSYALSVDAFDHLKAMQRAYERREGARMTNSQALERLLNEHLAGHFGSTPTN
ncbi:hypothetical protein [Hydrogenophaga sp. RWCD_12]|uniref:hypothetical protein n=1 Tax=Hydrogenophaga sp. RWCD_12 TaxID=3391190 RepID=UPI00398485FC